MIAVIQRVKSAFVIADGENAGTCGFGLYILLGVTKEDTEADATALAEKISKLRIFTDDNDKMNLSALDVGAEALVVSNFTLNANYEHGNRPDYFASAAPDEANRLYEYFVRLMRGKLSRVETGVFGADMQTTMVTDGPVTIVMDSKVLINKGKVNR